MSAADGMSVLTVEEVTAVGRKTGERRLVGWEVIVSGKRYMVFRDQSTMPGLRDGERDFVPGLDEVLMKEKVLDAPAAG